MKFNQLKNNFSSGELSELLVGRVDLEEYQNGCQTVSHFIPLKQGGVRFRNGTQIVAPIKQAATVDNYINIPFISDDEAYNVVISESGTNLINDQIKIYTANGTPCTITDLTSDSIFNGLPYYRATWNTAWIANYAGLTGGNAHYAQSGDIMVIVSSEGNVAPILLLRTAVTAFTVTHYLGYLDSRVFGSAVKQLVIRPPYDDKNLSATTFTPAATTGNTTLTASTATFTSTMIGRQVRITHAGVTGVAYITAFTSSTVVSITTIVNFGAITATTNWEMSAWYAGNYPKSVTFFEQRLCFGGTFRNPDSVYVSEQGDIFQMMQTRLAQDSSTDTTGLGFFGSALVTDPFLFTIYSGTGAKIQNMVGTEFLYIGTKTGLFLASGGQEQSLSIASIFIQKVSSIPCLNIMSKVTDTGFVFAGLDGKSLYEMEVGGKNPSELSLLFAEKITGIIDIEWQPQENILWVLATEGLFGVTIDKMSKVIAWFRAPLSGLREAGSYVTQVKSIACLPYNDSYRPYFVVTRDYGFGTGGFEASLEVILPPGKSLSFLSNQEVFLDRADLANAAGSIVQTTFPAGARVVAMSEGNVLGDYLVNGSKQINLTPITPTNPVVMGFLYRGAIKSMPFEAGQTFGQAQGLPRRVDRLIFRPYLSRGGEYQADVNNKFAILADADAVWPATFSGEKEKSLNASPHDVTLTIEQNTPAPMTLLWTMLRGVTYDG